MASPVKYPAPGCVVEYLEDNSLQIAYVLEESGGKLRLLLPSRRETKLAANRVLPWTGPLHSSSLSREEAVKLLESHKKLREERVTSIDPLEVWNVSSGEIERAPAQWFAELFESEPDEDWIAAFGRALLACKTHFRYNTAEFEVFDEVTVNKRLEERQAKAEREALVEEGASFLHKLWTLAQKKQSLTEVEAERELSEKSVRDRIQHMLWARVVNPDTQDDATLWNQLGKGLPDVPHLPLQLLTAWGKLPPHYNFWLDRADFEPGEEWTKEFSAEIAKLVELAASQRSPDGLTLEDLTELPFISIDGSSTLDIDDAFYIKEEEDGYQLDIALAFPALAWPFGSNFDKKISHRASSLYLPEHTWHMLPETLGIGAYSLFAAEDRPAFCLRFKLDKLGAVKDFMVQAARVRLAANLHYKEAQEVLDGGAGDNRASPYFEQLKIAHNLAILREEARIAAGAIIMQRPEPAVILEGEGEDIKVEISQEPSYPDAQRLVTEMMVLASAALADWAFELDIPLIHRTQNVTLPREYSGVWSEAADLARIMHALMPSILEVNPKPHSALGLSRYAPVTSPLRRYADLLNEAQILKYLESGQARWSREELEQILNTLNPALDAVTQVQRFRPRYWKLLYFRQHGDREWWPAVITEENENFVNIALTDKGLFVRGRRRQFDERAAPGMHVLVRLGKVNPLYNEIQIMEVLPEE